MWVWIGAAIGVAAAIVAAIYAIGMALPVDHRASGEAIVAAPRPLVAERIRNVAAQPQWRGGVRAIEGLAREGDGIRYVEVARSDKIAFRLVEAERDARFVSTIDDAALPFGGSWTITLTGEGNATRVRIEENGRVTDPAFRFFARFVFGHERTIRAYLADLARSFSPGA